MFLSHRFSNGHAAVPADLAALRAFLHEQGEALVHAAERLGGRKAVSRACLLLDEAPSAERVTRPMLRALHDLHRLLMLEDVGDPEAIETSLFAAIPAGSPECEALCLLADRLQDLLDEMEEAREEAGRACPPAA